jgi:hypothetical protein
VTISDITGSGTIGISLAQGTACDSAGNNAPAAGPSETFTVQAATIITEQPDGQAVFPGDTAVFTVTATGDGTLSYQWQKDEGDLTDGGHFSGATTATLTVSSAAWADVGSYRCVVTASCGATASDAAALTMTCHDPAMDTDGDNDVDLVDFGVFQACFNGPNRPYASLDPRCVCHDSDCDGDVDLTDYGQFQACFNGPNRPPLCSGTGCSGDRMQGQGMLVAPVDGFAVVASFGGGEGEDVAVVFDLQSPQTGQAIQAGLSVEWSVLASVEGAGASIAACDVGLELRQDSEAGDLVNLPIPAPTFTIPLSDDSTVWRRLGPNTTTPGTILGIGDALAVPWSPAFGRVFADAPPVVVGMGSINTGGLVPGHYVLILRPTSATVLRDDVDFGTSFAGGYAVKAAALSGVDRIEFDISPR